MTSGGTTGEATDRSRGRVLELDVGPARSTRAVAIGAVSGLLVLPASGLLVWLIALPVLRMVRAATTGAGGGVIWLDRIATVLSSDATRAVVWRTFLWAVVAPLVVVAAGYGLAVAARWCGARRGWVRAVLLASSAVPLAVTGVTFRLLVDPDVVLGWLGPGRVTGALGLAFVWAWVGLAYAVFDGVLDESDLPLGPTDTGQGDQDSKDPVDRGTGLGKALVRPMRDERARRTAVVVFTLVAVATVRVFDLILVMVPRPQRADAEILPLTMWEATDTAVAGSEAALAVVWLAGLLAGVTGMAAWARRVRPIRQRVPDERSATSVPEDGSVGSAVPDSWVTPKRAGRIVMPVVGALWVVPVIVLGAVALGMVSSAVSGRWWLSAPDLDAVRSAFAWGILTDSLIGTTVVATVATAGVVALALPAAYALSWLAPPGTQVGGIVLAAAAVVPVHVLADPLSDALVGVGLVGSLAGLLVVHVVLGLPFAVLVLRNALSDLPEEDIRRSRLEAKSTGDTFRKAALKILPALSAVVVLEFVQVWNDLFVGLRFPASGSSVLGPLVHMVARNIGAGTSGMAAATAFVAAVVPVTIVVLARDEIVHGLVRGVRE